MGLNIRDIHNKIYRFEAADDAPGFFKCFFNFIICSPLGHATLVQKVEERKDGKLDVYELWKHMLPEAWLARYVETANKKLTADAVGEPPSAMRVVGCERHFHYGPEAGASGCFRARLHHASVEPKSEEEHLKLAFFFRKSSAGERRAKRAKGGDELAQRRKDIAGMLRA